MKQSLTSKKHPLLEQAENREKKARRKNRSKVIIPLTKEEKKLIKMRISEINGIWNEPSTQNAVPYRDMTKDGICVVPKSYFGGAERKDFFSKTLSFGDINYQLASDEDQCSIFDAYCHILNYFDDSVFFQMTFENRRRDNDSLAKKLVIEEQDDNFNDIRREYSEILKSKLQDGDNGNELVKFLTFGVFAKNLKEAKTRLGALSAEIIAKFKKAKILAKELSGEERLSMLYRALNPNRRNKFMFNWEYARKLGHSTKDYIAPTSMTFEKRDFELGDCFGSVMSINLIASELKDSILYEILNEPHLFCINMHVKPFNITAGKKLIKNTLLNVKAMRSEKRQKAYATGGDPDCIPEELEESIEELRELLRDLNASSQKLFQMSFTIRAYAKTRKELKAHTDLLRRIFENNFIHLVPCDYQQEAGLAASLPIGVTKIFNNRILHTASLAAFMPFSGSELFHINSPRSMYLGINAVTRNMILACVSQLKNPNSLILGTPGSGKSFIVKLIIALTFLKTNEDIFITDPEGEYHPLVNALGGQVVKLSAVSKNYLNPMDIIFDKALIAEEDPLPDKIDFIVSLMELIVGGTGITSTERSLIDRAAGSIYKSFLNSNPTAEKMPTLGDLYDELLRYGEAAHRISSSLEMYVSGTQNFFNHKSNVDIDNRIVCFDIRNLGASLRKLGMLIVQETVWNRVSANRNARKHSRFFIDEFHLLLKDTETAKYSVEVYKRFRKWYATPCGITQNVSDFFASEQIESIFKNTEFYYLLNQSSDDRYMLMEKLQISHGQAEFITNSEPGCGILKFGETIIPFENKFPKDTKIYKLITTKPEDDTDTVENTLSDKKAKKDFSFQ